MQPRVIDEGHEHLEGSVRRDWRVVEWAPDDYRLQEIFSPAERRLQRTWRVTPLDSADVWRQHPSEAPKDVGR